MLAAAQRLRRRAEFTAAVRGGRRASRGVLVVHVTHADGASQPEAVDAVSTPARAGEPARAGFVVSKAIGNAVVRNRVRRQLRHLMRGRLVALPAGTDVVVRALPGAALCRYPQLEKDLDAALVAALRPRGPRRPREAGT